MPVQREFHSRSACLMRGVIIHAFVARKGFEAIIHRRQHSPHAFSNSWRTAIGWLTTCFSTVFNGSRADAISQASTTAASKPSSFLNETINHPCNYYPLREMSIYLLASGSKRSSSVTAQYARLLQLVKDCDKMAGHLLFNSFQWLSNQHNLTSQYKGSFKAKKLS